MIAAKTHTPPAKAVPENSGSKAPFFNKSGQTGQLEQQLSESTPETLQRESFFTPTVPALQAKCAHCEQEEINKKEETPFFQTKLTIGQPGDKYEQEADAMADKVVQRMATAEQAPHATTQADTLQLKPQTPTLIQRKCASCGQEEMVQRQEEEPQQDIQPDLQTKIALAGATTPPDDEQPHNPIQRKCAACEREEKLQKKTDHEQEEQPAVMTKSESGQTFVSSDLQSRLSATKGGGSALPDTTRSSMEGAFGADFSGVRVHTDSSAVLMNQELNAHAFTHGRDVYFNAGKYNPGSTDGQKLLAHELTHTVQQGGSARQKEVRRKSENNVPMDNAPEASPNAGVVQRDTLDDITGAARDTWDATGGRLTGAATNLILDQIRPLAPNLVAVIEQIRSEGVLNFFKTKLLQGINGIFDGLQNNSSQISSIFPGFGELVIRARVIVNALASGDCQPLFAALNDLKELVTQLAGDAWDAIVEFYQPAIDFFTDVWNSFALPAMEWLKAKAMNIWSWIQDIGSTIWRGFLPIREAVGGAWDYIKGIIGLNAEETGEEGLIQWAQRKAGEVWEEVKETLRPIIEPARAMVAKIQAVIPLTAILNLRKTIQDWLQKVVATSTAMGEDASNVGNEAAQTSLRDQILPAVQQSIEQFRGNIAEAASWVNGKIGEVFTSVGQFFTTVRNIEWLSVASGAIEWVEVKATELNDWVQSKITTLFDIVSQGLHNVGDWLKPIYDALVKIMGILGDILGKLPDFLMGPLWMLLPECIKEPIKKFFLEQILGRMSFFQKLQQVENIWERLEAAALVILKQIFVDGNLRKAIWTFFSTMLDLLGLPPQLVMRVITKAAQNLSDILQDPLGFLGNFIRALKLGFEQFFNNIGTHLLSGLQAWLFSKLDGSGIEMPQDLSFKSMLKLAFQILGITVDMLLRVLEEVTGKKGLKAKIEGIIGAISNAWAWFEALLNQGEEGGSIWDRLGNAIGSIWDMILDGVVSWLENTIIVRALAWVATKLDPTGVMAVITTIIDVFNVFQAIMDKAREILEMIERVLDGLGDLIKGIIAAAANVLERALAAAIPVAMAILSALFGLDGVVDKVKEVIKKLREKVEAGIKRVMTSIKNWIERMLGRGGQSAAGEDTLDAALREIDAEGAKERDEEEVTQSEANAIKDKVNSNHSETIHISSVSHGEGTWDFEYEPVIQRQKRSIVDRDKHLVLELTGDSRVSITNSHDGRTRPRQSEIDTTEALPGSREQVSYIGGVEVPYGTKGSVRPDNIIGNTAVEVKNYRANNEASLNRLYNTIENQYSRRVTHLPPGTHQRFVIDVRGQDFEFSSAGDLFMLRRIETEIKARTSTTVEVQFIFSDHPVSI